MSYKHSQTSYKNLSLMIYTISSLSSTALSNILFLQIEQKYFLCPTKKKQETYSSLNAFVLCEWFA